MHTCRLPRDRTALLLDFDGVIIRNHRVQRYVGNTCTRYLAREAGIRFPEAARINRIKYPKYGHSSYILSYDYKVPCSIAAFNVGVYKHLIDPSVVQRLLTPEDRTYALSLLNMLRKHGWMPDSTFIFTNAMDSWCLDVLNLLNLDLKAFTNHGILSSNALGALKPTPHAYKEAEFLVSSLLPNADHFVFVDDHEGNLVIPKSSKTKWYGIHYPANMQLEQLSEEMSKKLRQVIVVD